MTSFLSTYVNNVDKKGRVSVPAAYRAALKDETFQGLIVYPSLFKPALLAFGQSKLDRAAQAQEDKQLQDATIDRDIAGQPHPKHRLIDHIAPLTRGLAFDPEGRIVLPESFVEHAGINGQVAFVGRNTRIELWAPEQFERAQVEERQRILAGFSAEDEL